MRTPKGFAFMFKPLPVKSETEREQNHTDTQNHIVITTQFRGDRTRPVRLVRRRLESASSVRFSLLDPTVFLSCPPAAAARPHRLRVWVFPWESDEIPGLGTVLLFSSMAEARGVERHSKTLTSSGHPKEMWASGTRHILLRTKTPNDNLCRWCSKHRGPARRPARTVQTFEGPDVLCSNLDHEGRTDGRRIRTQTGCQTASFKNKLPRQRSHSSFSHSL